jgi:hypothetical protein
MTAAPTAYSSVFPLPESGATDPSRDAATMPLIAARLDPMTNTATLILVTLMPARRAASALPPTA